MKEKIITLEDAYKIVNQYVESFHPTENPPTEDQCNQMINEFIDKTRWEVAKLMWPDNPDEQFKIFEEILD